MLLISISRTINLYWILFRSLLKTELLRKRKEFTMCVSVISMRHASEPFLAGCVPYLQLDRRVVDGDNFVLQRQKRYFFEFL